MSLLLLYKKTSQNNYDSLTLKCKNFKISFKIQIAAPKVNSKRESRKLNCAMLTLSFSALDTQYLFKNRASKLNKDELNISMKYIELLLAFDLPEVSINSKHRGSEGS